MPYNFVEDPESSEGREQYLLHFNGIPCATILGAGPDVAAEVDRLNREAGAVQKALDSDEPRKLCDLGWHRQRYEDGTPLYFRLLLGLYGARFGFRIGPLPFDYACTKMADLGGAKPWFCEVCEVEIGA